jgi:hypothetical protein
MKIVDKPKQQGKQVIKRKSDKKFTDQQKWDWWTAKNDPLLASQLCGTAAYLKQSQGSHLRSIALHARLYGNQSLFSFAGSNLSKLDQKSDLPLDRATFNLVSSVVDTLVSRLTQSRPAPTFLTDNGDYRERNLAKKLNNFILGEFYQTKAYRVGEFVLRDALVFGTGIVKIYEDDCKKVAIERVLLNEVFVDTNEGIYGAPRSMYQVKIIDRKVLEQRYPGRIGTIAVAEKATIDNSAEASNTISDLVLVVEGWHLPSGPDANDGKHVIACSSGVLFKEGWDKDCFPFVFLHHQKKMLGFWSRGVAENLSGTQMELNSLLYTISKSIKLVGVPRVFIERGSKVVKAHQNNEIGVLIEYSGTKPSYEVANCVPGEMYAERDRMIQYGYRQEGLSEMSASSQKPAGLNSGEAIRSYEDINTDRFAALSRRYDEFYVDLAYQIIDLAKEIATREGKYQTVFPAKKGTKSIDLPNVSLLKDPFVIQAFNESSLPRDPAGRLQKITEMVQSGMVSIQEGRRLLDYPDLNQVETLANAGEERIFYDLDSIIEDGDFHPPDPFINLELAQQIVVQYINLYATCKLEEDKMQLLRDYFTHCQTLVQAMQPPPAPAPQANPEALPTSPLVPNAPGAAPAQAPAQ